MIMTLNKNILLILMLFLTISCENEDLSDCDINGIETAVIATSFTEWKYFSVTDTGFVEIESDKGHDSFLLNVPDFLNTLKDYINSSYLQNSL